jgi:hypothetical protein
LSVLLRITVLSLCMWQYDSYRSTNRRHVPGFTFTSHNIQLPSTFLTNLNSTTEWYLLFNGNTRTDTQTVRATVQSHYGLHRKLSYNTDCVSKCRIHLGHRFGYLRIWFRELLMFRAEYQVGSFYQAVRCINNSFLKIIARICFKNVK